MKIKIPTGFYSIRPREIAGWQISINKVALNPPVSVGHGKTNSTASDVVLTADQPLADDLYQSFSFNFYVGKDVNGDIPFPVEQVCGSTIVKWDQVSTDGNEPEKPAPLLTISSTATTSDSTAAPASEAMATVGIVLGALGLFFGLVAVAISSILLKRSSK